MRLDDRTRVFAHHPDDRRARLAEMLDVAPGDLVLATDGNGKPHVVRPAGCWFSPSHCGPWLLLAVSRSGPVGADVESMERCAHAHAEASRSFSPAERKRLAALPAPLRPLAFARLWTAKEAVLKAVGHGILGGLEQPDMANLPDLDVPAPWNPKLLRFEGASYVVTWYMLTIGGVEAVAARADILPAPEAT